ncbi:MAG: hypothetical protein R2836_06955 [Chitinophagales bacterium]
MQKSKIAYPILSRKNSIKTTYLILFFYLLHFSSCTYYLGPNKWEKTFPKEANIFPTQNYNTLKNAINPVDFLGSELADFSNKNYIIYSDKFKDTILDVRVVFANLLLGKNIEQINADIQKFKAWGTTGTSSILNKKGDYDFSEIQWINIVYYFKDKPEILHPATARHIINHLIIDNGFKPKIKAPKTLGIIRETENHILMKETSRYLKNQWIFTLQNHDEKYDNSKNGMDDFLIHHLQEMLKTGFFEFNANPYISYTIEALLILREHTDNTEIKNLCTKILDAENWQYVLGSFNMKKYSPFRRRMSRVSITNLTGDRHGALMKIEWAKYHKIPLSEAQLSCCFDKALVLATSSYILPAQTESFLFNKPNAYYAKIGHGLKSSPEIYYGTPNFLLSAGGLRFGKKSQIVPRPTTLFLNDNVKEINDCFYIAGKGVLNQWNNTGVYQNFAVGNQPVNIPTQYTIYEKIGNWNIYKTKEENPVFVCVYNSKNFGVIYVSQNENYKTILKQNSILNKKKDEFLLENNQRVSYNLSNKKKWIITQINDTKTDKYFKNWKRFDVKFYKTNSTY